MQQHQDEAAAPLYLRALIIWGKIYGEENPWLSADLSNLATCYEHMKNYADAELALRRAVSNDEKGLPPDSPELAADLNNLGSLYFVTGHSVNAAPLLQRALNIRTKTLGLTDPDTFQTITTYANVLRALHRNPEAEELEAKAKAVRKTP